jgi:hypothetical protein
MFVSYVFRMPWIASRHAERSVTALEGSGKPLGTQSAHKIFPKQHIFQTKIWEKRGIAHCNASRAMEVQNNTHL